MDKKETEGMRMGKNQMLLKLAAMLMSVVIASNFLAILPVQAVSQADDNLDDLELVHYTIIANDTKGSHAFEIAIDESRIVQAEQTIAEQESAEAENAMTEIVNEIQLQLQLQLTEEQRQIIHDAKTMKILSEGSYLEVTGWIVYWGSIIYGVTYHVFLSAVDAINYDTAINVAIALFAILTVVLLETIVGAVLCGVVTLILSMIKIDYGAVYGADHNEDNSLDVLGGVTLWQTVCNFAVIETPRYIWLLTTVGAYIIRDKSNPAPPITRTRRSSGTSARIR